MTGDSYIPEKFDADERNVCIISVRTVCFWCEPDWKISISAIITSTYLIGIRVNVLKSDVVAWNLKLVQLTLTIRIGRTQARGIISSAACSTGIRGLIDARYTCSSYSCRTHDQHGKCGKGRHCDRWTCMIWMCQGESNETCLTSRNDDILIGSNRGQQLVPHDSTAMTLYFKSKTMVLDIHTTLNKLILHSPWGWPSRMVDCWYVCRSVTYLGATGWHFRTSRPWS